MEKTLSNTELIKDTLAKVISYCQYNLSDDETISKYLSKNRGLTNNTINKFGLGAFPRNIYTLLNKFDSWDLQQAGIINHVNGKPYSKFCFNRAIIPIYDPYGSPVAIIGRTLLDEETRKSKNVNKYDNTRFAKSSCLFGLNHAIDSIREKNEAIIVEGNLDVISAHQYGQTNVVAISSASFTKSQASLIGRYTSNIKLMLDNDEAGRKATENALSKLNLKGINITEFSFPKEFKDPDEYFRSL